jgi:ketosteroid isomerase-like protein
MTALTHADVLAGARRAIATYTQALDDGRTADVVATFCPDGACDMGEHGTFQGHEALTAAFGGWKPQQPARHLVVNTLVTDWDDEEAQVSSDVVLLVKGKGGWGVEMVGRYHDVLHRGDDGTWRFHLRSADFVP